MKRGSDVHRRRWCEKPQGKHHEMMEADRSDAEDGQLSPECGRGMEQILPHRPQKELTLLKP